MRASIRHPRAVPFAQPRAAIPCNPPAQHFRSHPTTSLLTPLPSKLWGPKITSQRPLQHPPVPAVAETAVSVTEETLFRVATGVPLVDIFHKLTLAEAAIQSAGLIGIAVIAVLFGNQIIAFVGSKLESFLGRVGEDAPRGPIGQLFGTVIDAAEKPCQALLPWFGFAYCSTVISAFSEVAVERITQNGTGGFWEAAGANVMNLLCDFAQLMQDASEIVIIVFW